MNANVVTLKNVTMLAKISGYPWEYGQCRAPPYWLCTFCEAVMGGASLAPRYWVP